MWEFDGQPLSPQIPLIHSSSSQSPSPLNPSVPPPLAPPQSLKSQIVLVMFQLLLTFIFTLTTESILRQWSMSPVSDSMVCVSLFTRQPSLGSYSRQGLSLSTTGNGFCMRYEL